MSNDGDTKVSKFAELNEGVEKLANFKELKESVSSQIWFLDNIVGILEKRQKSLENSITAAKKSQDMEEAKDLQKYLDECKVSVKVVAACKTEFVGMIKIAENAYKAASKIIDKEYL